MLGLGNSINRSGFVGGVSEGPLFFRSLLADDFFDTISVRQSVADLTITANQSAPDSSTGWLNVLFDLKQTGVATFRHASILDAIVIGQDYKISFDIFLNDGLNSIDESHWPSPPTTTQVALGGQIVQQDITAGVATLFEQTLTASANASANLEFYLFWNLPSGDHPNADAQFYIKDLKVEDA